MSAVQISRISFVVLGSLMLVDAAVLLCKFGVSDPIYTAEMICLFGVVVVPSFISAAAIPKPFGNWSGGVMLLIVDMVIGCGIVRAFLDGDTAFARGLTSSMAILHVLSLSMIGWTSACFGLTMFLRIWKGC